MVEPLPQPKFPVRECYDTDTFHSIFGLLLSSSPIIQNAHVLQKAFITAVFMVATTSRPTAESG